jgi:hypothetical protein
MDDVVVGSAAAAAAAAPCNSMSGGGCDGIVHWDDVLGRLLERVAKASSSSSAEEEDSSDSGAPADDLPRCRIMLCVCVRVCVRVKHISMLL